MSVAFISYTTSSSGDSQSCFYALRHCFRCSISVKLPNDSQLLLFSVLYFYSQPEVYSHLDLQQHCQPLYNLIFLKLSLSAFSQLSSLQRFSTMVSQPITSFVYSKCLNVYTSLYTSGCLLFPQCQISFKELMLVWMPSVHHRRIVLLDDPARLLADTLGQVYMQKKISTEEMALQSGTYVCQICMCCIHILVWTLYSKLLYV